MTDKPFGWNENKNALLKIQRGVSFDDVVAALGSGNLFDNSNHPNPDRYPNQKIYIVEIRDYAYIVPYVEDKEKIFLKTIFPSRKATKKHLKK